MENKKGIWVCPMCGKTAKTRNGEGEKNGWDVSCSMHAILCDEDSLEYGENGRVVKADALESKNDKKE